MTNAIEFGPEIKRDAAICGGHWPPKWLKNGDPADCQNSLRQWVNTNNQSELLGWAWDYIPAIRLPITHPASIAQRWNDDNPGEKPFTVPHFGSADAPSDYDGGAVLDRDGAVYAYAWPQKWQHDGNFAVGEVVAYRSKPSEQTVEDDSPSTLTNIAIEAAMKAGGVFVPMISEAQVQEWLRDNVERFPLHAGKYTIGYAIFRALGAIAHEETPVERFKRENPGLSADELLEKALGR